MFHWICPECGQEIAPGVKECPVCEPQASAPPLTATGLQATVALTPEVILPAAPVIAEPVAERPVSEPQVVILQPAVVLQPEVLQPRSVEIPKPRTVLEALPAEAQHVVLPRELHSDPQEPETFADRLADLAERLHGEHIPYEAQHIIPSSASPATASRKPIVIDVTPAKPFLTSPPSALLLAEPQAPAMADEIPMEQVFDPRPAGDPAQSSQPIKAEPLEAELSGLCVVLGPVVLPQPPDSVASPALAPLEDYREAADRLMRPAELPIKPAKHRVILNVSLPGPALPRELMSLQAAGLVPIRPGRTRHAASPSRIQGWNTKFVVVGILLTAGLAATYSVIPGAKPSSPPKPIPDPGPEKPISARSTNSLARFVEVTGIRFVELNRKPQIHYLVVNHSNAPLSSVTVYVTLRTSSWKPGQPPLSRFSFRSPALEAFEAKEMASPIERVTESIELPDWQDLHADVEVQ